MGKVMHSNGVEMEDEPVSKKGMEVDDEFLFLG